MSGTERRIAVVDGSNVAYEPHLGRHPWVEDRRLPFMIVRDQVYLFPDGGRR